MNNSNIDLQPKSTRKTDEAYDMLRHTYDKICFLNLDKEEILYIQQIIIGMALAFNQADKRYQLPQNRILQIMEDILDQIYRAQLIDAVDNTVPNMTTNKHKGFWV